MGRFRLRTFGAVVAVAAVGAVIAPGALADAYDDAAASCGQPLALEQPFLPFGDPLSYFLLRNGSFESGAADWGLTGAATLIEEDEPDFVDSSDDSTALLIPRGSAATSAPVCVSVLTPTIRFFTRTNNAAGARLKIEAVFKDSDGKVKALPVAMIAASTKWAPTEPLPLLLTAIAAVSQQNALGVSFRFTAVTGNWKIDRIYVDPLKDC